MAYNGLCTNDSGQGVSYPLALAASAEHRCFLPAHWHAAVTAPWRVITIINNDKDFGHDHCETTTHNRAG